MFKCLECGKTYKRMVEECSRCGGGDIDLAYKDPYTVTTFGKGG